MAGLPFTFLPLLFALAVPLGMVKRDREVAVYSAAVGYLALLLSMNFILDIQGINSETMDVQVLIKEGMTETRAVLYNSQFTNVLGLYVYNTNVIGGVITGLITVIVHNRFRNTILHESMTFYSGKRFVPIINTIIMAIVGAILTVIWPFINNLIMNLGTVISNAKIFGVFLYGMLEKLLNPTGMHHILNQTFRFTALGGVETINGNTLVGCLQIFLYQLENNLPFSIEATKYLAQGKILHMVFGMPGAVFAIIKMAKPENRKKVLSYYTAGLTAVILTGITEPIEFTFIFLSPILWIANSILTGLSFLIPYLLGVTIGNIQGGIIDWFVFGVLQGIETKWYIYLIAGPIFFAIYYFVYSFIISRFNINTIGRKDDMKSENKMDEVKLEDREKLVSKKIVDGLGGVDNILDVDNCISRLRVVVKNPNLIDEKLIEETDPMGIIRPSKTNIQIVYGGRITKIRAIVDDYIYLSKENKE